MAASFAVPLRVFLSATGQKRHLSPFPFSLSGGGARDEAEGVEMRKERRWPVSTSEESRESARREHNAADEPANYRFFIMDVAATVAAFLLSLSLSLSLSLALCCSFRQQQNTSNNKASRNIVKTHK